MSPRLPSFSAKKIISILLKIGFELDHITGSHHIYYRAYDKRRVTVPFHKKDLPKGTVISILRQAGISRKDLDK